MIDVATVPGPDLRVFRRLFNHYVDREASLAAVREWHGAHPDLLVGAYRDGDLVGGCLGRPRSADAVELAGVAVEPPYRRRGVGSRLLAALEERAASRGRRRVTLGSAGGYVDEFYRANGYAPESVLVRPGPDGPPEAPDDLGYPLLREAVEDGTRKLYVGVDGYDPAELGAIRDAFDDPEAIYVMEKRLDARP